MKYRINKEKEWLKGRSKKYVIVLNPGKYSKDYRVNIPIGLLLRQQKIKQSLPELRKILNQKKISVNGKIITQRQYPVCVLDVITIEGIHYRVNLNKRYKLQKLTEPITYHSIVKYNELKKGVTQLICKGGFVYLNTQVPKPLKEHVILRNFEKNIVKICHYSELTHFIVIKGKHKGHTDQLKNVKIENNIINLEPGEVKIEYVLFYNQ